MFNGKSYFWNKFVSLSFVVVAIAWSSFWWSMIKSRWQEMMNSAFAGALYCPALFYNHACMDSGKTWLGIINGLKWLSREATERAQATERRRKYKPAYLIKQSACKWDRLVPDHDARTSTLVRLRGRVYQEEEGEREFLIGSTMKRKMLQQKQSTKRERESERKRTLWIGAGWSEIIFLLLVASKVHPHQAQTVCTARSLRKAEGGKEKGEEKRLRDRKKRQRDDKVFPFSMHAYIPLPPFVP